MLLALIGLINYIFIYIDVGAAGRAGDAGVFGYSAQLCFHPLSC
jgi:hypothetical protein